MSEKTIVTKRFRWEMAHFIHNDTSKCMNIHGHSFGLEVSVYTSNTETDMILHTGDLKALIQPLIDCYDHCLLMRECDETKELANFLAEKFGIHRVQFLPSGKNPTMENMIEAFADFVLQVLPPGIMLHKVRLTETETVWIEKLFN